MKAFPVTALCLALTLFISAQKNTITSSRLSFTDFRGGHIGNNGLLKFSNIGHDLSLAVSNDSTRLYVFVKMEADGLQPQVFLSGIQLFFDVAGKRSEKAAVKFPVPPPAPNEPVDGPLVKEKNQRIVKGIEVKGLVNVPDTILPLNNAQNIRAALKMDDDHKMIVVYQIPLWAVKLADPLPQFTLGILIAASGGNDMPPPPPDGPPPGMGADGGGPMGPPPGINGGPPPPFMMGNSDFKSEIKVWVKVKAAAS